MIYLAVINDYLDTASSAIEQAMFEADTAGDKQLCAVLEEIQGDILHRSRKIERQLREQNPEVQP